jgi:recombination protein RecT
MSIDTSKTSAALATRRTASGQPTVAHLIEQMKPEIARALPAHMDADRLARIALTVFRQTPGLQKCTPDSFLGALMTTSQLGLEPGPLGHAYFVPFGDKVTFIIGYKGLIDLAYRSGRLISISCHTIHANEKYSVRYGLDDTIEHEPIITGDRGDPVAYYAVAKLKDGGVVFDVMSRDEVDAIRKRSRSGNSGPWVTDYEQMAWKTVLRRLSKRLPLSVEFAQAINNDGQVRTDVTPAALDEATYEPERPAVDDVVDAEILDFDPETGEALPVGAGR